MFYRLMSNTMSSTINVTVHASQFPQIVQEGLLEGLRTRCVPPKFHYQSYKQAELWLALHRAHSPVCLEPECAAIYDRGFAVAAGLIPERGVRLTSLGCGGGEKEVRLLRLLAAAGKELSYHPCDVSLPLVLAAVCAAHNACPTLTCEPLMCDLALADDLPQMLSQAGESGARQIITCFGLLPNFEPANILPKLAALVRPDDLLLLSANLAPGTDYRAGVQRVLSGYDNAETRAWLLAFLFDLGAEPGDGRVDFSIEEASGLFRIVADFRFLRDRVISVHGERFPFCPGDAIRLFFSYRHTPERLRGLLQAHGLQVAEQWISTSEEEGVFLCRKTAG
jgi:L-histidine N-alpha-methyltransferase